MSDKTVNDLLHRLKQWRGEWDCRHCEDAERLLTECHDWIKFLQAECDEKDEIINNLQDENWLARKREHERFKWD